MSIKEIPLAGYKKYSGPEMVRRSLSFLKKMRTRRSVREFSSEAIDEEVILNCIRAAGTAPNGANMQPWQFIVVKDPETRRRIRIAAEAEEQKFYAERAPEEWLKALAPLGTDANKPFLEEAPYLIVIFAVGHHLTEDGKKIRHYYVQESVGIATGLLICAIHHAGLVCLTHTPSPMGFLTDILERPSNERPYLLLVVGHPKERCRVPDIRKKPLAEIARVI